MDEGTLFTPSTIQNTSGVIPFLEGTRQLTDKINLLNRQSIRPSFKQSAFTIRTHRLSLRIHSSHNF